MTSAKGLALSTPAHWVTIDVGGWGGGSIGYTLISGTVTSDLECTTDTWCSLSQICWMQVSGGTNLTVTATPDTGSSFDTATAQKGQAVGWTLGPCRGSTNPCTLTVASDLEMEADFAFKNPLVPPAVKQAFGLEVDIAGYGDGTVSATTGAGTGTTPVPLDCFNPESPYYRAVCSADVSANAVVTLTPSAAAGCSFVGWSGSGAAKCSGLGACTVTMSAAQDVVATFMPNCAVPNGTGVQSWDAATNKWACTATACNTGYSLTNGACGATNPQVYGVYAALGGVLRWTGSKPLYAQQVVLTSAVTVTLLGNVTPVGAAFDHPQYRMALYTDAGGAPSQKLFETGFQANPGGRNEVTVTPYALPAGTYWIAFQFQDVNGYLEWYTSPNLNNAQSSVYPDPDVAQALPSTFPAFGAGVSGAVNLYLSGS